MTYQSLIVDLLPIEYSTRSRKITHAHATIGPVLYVSLASAGRFGIRVEAGARRTEYVDAYSVDIGILDTRRTFRGSVVNLATYLPAYWRLTRRVVRQPAKVVAAQHVAVLPIALLHRARHRSSVLFDGRERPGGIRTRGSLATWLSRVERPLFRATARHVRLVTAVCESHAGEYRSCGFSPVLTLRNVPELVPDVPPDDRSPETGHLVVAYVGSLYPGRGLEPLIRAVAIARSRGTDVRVEVTGLGDETYVTELASETKRLGVNKHVRFLGPCEHAEVTRRYLRADVGCALYEPVDKANDSLSNKLFECMAVGRGVIAGDLPENRRIVERYGVGWCIPVEPEPLAVLLERLAADPEGVAKANRNARLAHVSELHWAAEAAPYVSHLRDIVATTDPG